MAGPVLWGPNSISTNLQNGELLGNGTLINSNGPKNYLTYSNFENNATTGWSLAHSSLTSNFPSTVGTAGNSFSSAGGAHGGSAANGNLSLSIVSSGQLAGNYSSSYSSSSATTAGDMIISDAVTIDIEDQAKVLTFKFYYQAQTNPGNGNWSGTSSNSFGVAIYDVTNAAWIMPAGVWNLTQSFGVGYTTGTFQTTSNSTQYQLAIFNANASSGAITVYLDDFFMGPQTAPSGPIVTDWVQYTPGSTQGFGTVSAAQVWSRRTGDSLEVQGRFTAGTTTSSNAQISLGFNGVSGNVTIDSTKLSVVQNVGDWLRNLADAGEVTYFVLALGGNTYFQVGRQDATSTPLTTAQGNQVADTSGAVSFNLKVPITGWSSNSNMSADTDTRVIAASYYLSTNTAFNNAIMKMDTKVVDTSGSYSTSSGQFTAPVSGNYLVTAQTAGASGTTPTVEIRKNATSVSRFYPSANSITTSGSTVISCIAGDLIDLFNTVSTTFTGNAVGDTQITITRLSGPAVVTATESVNARYYASATSISSSLATISWSTKDFDSHNQMSSGTYTVPVTGKYQINSGLLVTGTITLNSTLIMEIQKNSTVVSRSTEYLPASLTDGKVVIGDIISCIAGDTLRIQVSCSATGPSIVSSNFDNYISLSRVGN